MKLPVAILASGSGTNLQAIIDAVRAGRLGADLRLVLSDNPKARALERAKAAAVPTAVVTKKDFPIREEFDKEVVRLLKAAGVELVVLAGFMRLVTKPFLDAFPMRIINIHPSLLPAFPGLDVQRKAVEHGVKFSGCTVHFVDEGLDSGPIIMQAVVPVLEGDDAEALKARILEKEHVIYPAAIQCFAEGRVKVRERHVFIEGARNPEGALFNPLSGFLANERRGR
jgi:phosphoribosylglycinamide formyltransferase-1